MLFAYPMGVQGNVISPGSTTNHPELPTDIGNVRKLADDPEAVRGLSFKSKENSAG